MKPKFFFAAIMSLLCTASLWASGISVDGIWYLFDDENLTASVSFQGHYYSYNKYSGSLVIPSEVSYKGKTYSVASIGSSAFYNCSSLTSIEIPNSVTSIGESAFSNCSGITSIEIPNSVTSIGSSAFFGCSSITSIEIPNSVTSIGESAFSNCSGITSIEIPNSVTSIGEYAFSGCSSLSSIEIPNSVTSIGRGAFVDILNIVYSGTATGSPWGAKCINGFVEGSLIFGDESKTNLIGCFRSSVGEIIIPNSIISIGDYAFCSCSSLTSIEIPNSVTSIGSAVFQNCTSLTSFEIPNTVTSIGVGAFLGCSSLTSIEIPNSVTSIGGDAFAYCSSLTSIVVESGNKVYDSRYNCNAIIETASNTLIAGCQTTIIPNSVISIGEEAFHGCSSLTSVEIPNSVTSIGNFAFSGCSSLTSIKIPNSVTSIGTNAFSHVLNIVYSGTATTGSPWGAQSINGFVDGPLVFIDESKEYLVSCSKSVIGKIIIPNSVTSIGKYAFSGCSSITSIEIPNSVTSIGKYAFSGCSSLSSIEIPNSVTSIGRYAFSGCSSITSIEIPNSVTSIGEYAFSGCRSITSIEIPNSVTSIGESAFSNCSGITSIEIPNSVTSIGESAFSNCSGLTSVEIPNSVINIGSGAFFNCWSITSIEIPNSVISIGEEAFYGCSSLTSVEIPNSVTSIGRSAFSGCSSITSIEIPNSITSIGNSAFSGCCSLISIEIPNSVTSIGNYAFAGCSSFTSVEIPNSVTSIGNDVFQRCTSLVSIEIPNSVTSIGSRAFYNCSSLTSIVVESGNKVYDSRNNCNAIIETASNTLIAGCQTTIIPNSVTSIGKYAFHGCSSLTSIEIPNSVTSIGDYAFSFLGNLKQVTSYCEIPPTLGNNVFYNCGDLSQITLYVYEKSIDLYKSADIWKEFNIQPIPKDCSTLNSVVNIELALDPLYIGHKADGTVLNTTDEFNAQIEAAVTAWNAVETNAKVETVPTIELTSESFILTDVCGNSKEFLVLKEEKDVVRVVEVAGYACEEKIDSTITALSLGTITYDSIHVNITNAYKSVIMPEDENIKIEYNNGEYIYDNANLFIENFIATWNVVPENEPIASYSWSEPNNETCQLNITTQCGNEYNALYPIASQTCTPYLFFAIPAQDNQGNVTVITAPSCENNNTAVVGADAATGYEFLSWNDGNEDNPRTIQLTKNTILIANFKQADQWVQSYNVTVMSNDASLGYVRAEVTVTAVPYSGAKFLHWDDGSQENPRTLFLNEDITLLATFGRDQETQDIQAIGSDISVEGNNLVISGYENEDMAVYTIVGQMIYTGKVQPSLRIEQQGVYLVRIGDKVVKVQL